MSSDDAAEAFDALRAEIALLRRAVEGVSASKRGDKDYAPTLAKLMKLATSADEQLTTISHSPALGVTPEVLAVQIHIITVKAREDAQREMQSSRAVFTKAAADIQGAVGVLRDRGQQNFWLAYAAGAGALIGVAAWVLVSGPMARALPPSWQVPERMAAATLDLDGWQGGARMMAGADPAGWRQVTEALDLARDNQDLIAGCQKRALRLKREVRCEVRISRTAK